MSDREQAIKDVAEHSKYSEEQVRLKVNNALYWPLTEYAVAQRERVIQLERENAAKAERVIALERALREMRDHAADSCAICNKCFDLCRRADDLLGDH